MKVLALTADPSLEAAMNMMGDWEVVAVPDVETAAERAAGAEVMLIGLGILSDGVERAVAARHAGVALPVVVVGEGEAPEGSTITVVQRPFSLDDLRDAVQHAQIVPVEAPADEPEADAHPVAEEPEAAPAATTRAEPPDAREEAAKQERKVERVERVDDLTDDPELADLDLAEVHVEGEGTSARPLTLVPPPAEPAPSEPAAATEAPVVSPAPATPAPPAPSAPVQTPAPPTAPPPTPPVKAEPTSQPPPPPAAGQPPAAPTAQPVTPSRPLSRRERKKKKQQQRVRDSAPASPMAAKLAAGARAAREISELLRQLPMLRDAASLAEALIGEVVERFDPKVAVCYVRRGEKFEVVAGHGLSTAERTLSVPKGHAIFQEIGDDPDSILIAPVDLAKGIVSGIAGARTEALLIGPIAVEGSVLGFLLVGRDDFNDEELDVLDELVREAAPGVAVAQLLGELGAGS